LYGWDVTFDARRPAVALPPQPNGNAYANWWAKDGRIGGRRLLISRAESKKSKTKGQANRFRVAKQATNRDLARVAAATIGDWHWMTDKTGVRLDRAVWLQMAF
jgi:hypothetical protein